MKRERTLRVPVSAELGEAIDRAAESAGQSVADWMRALATVKLGRDPDEDGRTAMWDRFRSQVIAQLEEWSTGDLLNLTYKEPSPAIRDRALASIAAQLGLGRGLRPQEVGVVRVVAEDRLMVRASGEQ